MFVTYILKSKTFLKTYVGHTDDIDRRLIEHNDGKSTFSKRYRPWVIIYKERFKNLDESIKREKYFKSAAGRRWMRNNLFK